MYLKDPSAISACRRCNASVVRMGLLDATSSAVRALHIDTLSGTRVEGEQSAISAAGQLTLLV